MAAAIGPVATKNTCDSRDRPCNGSARTHAGVRWSAFGSGSGVGDGGLPESDHNNSGDERNPPGDDLDILIDYRRHDYSLPDAALGRRKSAGAGVPGDWRTLRPLSLHLPEAERAMARSLERYGQL